MSMLLINPIGNGSYLTQLGQLSALGEKIDDTDIFSQDDLGSETLSIDFEANLIPPTTPDDYDYKKESTARNNSELWKLPYDIAETESLLIAEVTPTNSVNGAVTLGVTTTGDQNDGSTVNGLSLRDAVMIANSNPNQHYQIALQPGATYNLDIQGINEFASKTGDVNIRGSKINFVTEGGEDKPI